ncbi:MAG: dihydroorotase [Chromatiales bacterium]|jgi:dihydroorotase
MAKNLIKNATLVNEGQIIQADLLIKDGRIEKVASDITASSDMHVLDAEGNYLLPGMIDDQVHFREPGLTHKGEIAIESRAAVAGGITSFMDMPNTNPQTVTLEALEEKYTLASDRAFANYAFYFGATNDNLEQIKRLDKNQTCGIKVFMGASTGNMLVDDEKTLEGIFSSAPMLVATHCEDTPTILANEEVYREKYGDEIPMACHPLIRSEEACYLSSSQAIALAKKHGTRLHVLHLTTARELDQFTAGKLDGKQITAEACVHHLYFDDRDYDSKGSFIKCNPAIKTPEDRKALWQALLDDRIDVIGTDHAPHTLEEKLNSSYFKTPAGLPLVQYALQMVLELVHDEVLDMPRVVEKTAHGPARMFGIPDRGYLREGYWADLVLVDMNRQQRIEREDVMYKCGWSPLEGRLLRSQIVATFVNGHLMYRQGLTANRPQGMRLQFQR